MKIPVSVLMVAGGNPEMSATAVKTLREHASGEYQLVFVDNASPPEEKMADAITPLLTRTDAFIRFDTQRSFSHCNNRGCDLAVGEYLLLLNNDTVTEGDWQKPLLEEGVKYAISGPNARELCIAEEEKAMMCQKKDGVMIDAEPDTVGAYIEGWCFFIKKSLYKKMGGLDETFWPFYCEDSDLCLRVKLEGGKLGKYPMPIRHIGSANTIQYVDKYFRQAIGMANNYKMYARWVKGALI